jgi:hypothetical protein
MRILYWRIEQQCFSVLFSPYTHTARCTPLKFFEILHFIIDVIEGAFNLRT